VKKIELLASYKCPLKELKVFDLLLNNDETKAMRHGVYMFFVENNTCMYIGMCSSSHFAHRLGGHFGMSPAYKMNTFLKRIVEKSHPEDDYSSYVKAVKGIGDYSYLMIDANGKGKKFIRKLEKQLHTLFLPSLNKLPKGMPKKNSNMDTSKKLELFLPEV
jgi:hypothetical protein